jgi:CLIP-associating protein 1/2
MLIAETCKYANKSLSTQRHKQPPITPLSSLLSPILVPISVTVMEEQAQSLLATLKRSSVAIDTKLAAFNNLKSSIKHQRVPESCQPAIFECIRLGITSQTSPTIISTAFSTLGHLIKRLSLQEQTNVIAAQTSRLLPTLQDRLGDQRESLRNAASQTLSDIWPYSKVEIERVIREGVLAGNNARAKEVAMLWVVKVRSRALLKSPIF